MTGDFEQTARLAESGDFVYLDPPYSAQRPRHGEYGYGSFDKSDESRLLVLLHDLDRIGAHFPLSYGGTAPTRDVPQRLSHPRHNLNINGVWNPTQTNAEREIPWARGFHAAMQPFGLGAYVNFLDHDDTHLIPTAYGKDKHRRLAELKRLYDPDNVFDDSVGAGGHQPFAVVLGHHSFGT